MNYEDPDVSTPDPAEEPRDRILEAAGERVFREGYPALNMDRLAEGLGMSKKTLYVHFPGKEAILRAFVERLAKRVSKRLDTVLADPTLDFPARLEAIIGIVFGTLARIHPTLFRDLQRYAPGVYRILDEVRSRNIPRVFGQLMREGIEQGYVRAEVDPDFAAFAWLQLIRGLVEPEALERTGLSPRQTVEKAFYLIWPGLLTDAGRDALAKRQPQDGKGLI